jgi:hypothetical protein
LIPDLIAAVRKAALFTKFDVRWGYNNVRIKKGDEWKAAFITPFGLYEPRVMFFGLNELTRHLPSNDEPHLPRRDQRRMAGGIHGRLTHRDQRRPNLPQKCVQRVLQKLTDHDLYLKISKCEFHKRRIEYLGVVLEHGQVQMDPTKVKGVADWNRPQNAKDVRSFLGFTGFLPILHQRLLENRTTPDRSNKEESEVRLDRKTTTGIRTTQNPDVRKTSTKTTRLHKAFTLSTDASGYGVGAVLAQDGQPDPRSGNQGHTQ